MNNYIYNQITNLLSYSFVTVSYLFVCLFVCLFVYFCRSVGTDYDICELVGLQSTTSIWSCLPAMGIEPEDLVVVLQVYGLVYQLWVLNQRT